MCLTLQRPPEGGRYKNASRNLMVATQTSYPSRSLYPARLPRPSYAAYLYISESVG